MKPIPPGINLIGIHGHAGAGKDTVAEWILQNFTDVYKEPFAGPLKMVCSHAFNIDLDDFYAQEKKEQTHPFWNTTPRKIAQIVGTELFRVGYGNDFWVRRMHGRISGELITERDGIYESGETIIIPDVRFQNEYDWLISQGGKLIVLTRPGADGSVGVPNHASEAGIIFDATHPNYLINNNDTLESLYAQVEAFIEWTGWKLCPTKFDVSEF